jgi:hypothetical protein
MADQPSAHPVAVAIRKTMPVSIVVEEPRAPWVNEVLVVARQALLDRRRPSPKPLRGVGDT